ncbi:MAG: methionyl-tRNA formyltransferase [Thermodesulfobacteriota bacterium]
MRVVFFGTPEFAVPSLQALVEAGVDVAAVVTAPDRPKGRGRKLAAPPVKEAALSLSLPVWQQASVRSGEFIGRVAELAPDFLAVVAYGLILSPELLAVPRHMCVNVHPSLLPRYRGPAPIPWALINGDSVTGVTTMAMDQGMDSGGILLQERDSILDTDTAESMHDRLAGMGARLLVRTLDEIANGCLQAVPQDPAGVTIASRLSKEDGRIEWNRSARDLSCFVRGMFPWPGAFTTADGQRLKLLFASVWPENTSAEPGTVLAGGDRGLLVATREGVLAVTRLQAEGGKPMPAGEYLRGKPIAVGSRLGM